MPQRLRHLHDFCIQCYHVGDGYRLTNGPPWDDRRGIVGIGWRVDGCPETKDEYRQRAWRDYGQTRGLSADIDAFLDYMVIGDLVWIRNWRSEYYLGKITGDCQYVDSPIFQQHDIASVRTCDWIRVARMDEVPGAVRSAFSRGPTVQRVSEPSSVAHSRFLFAELNPKAEPLPSDINLRGADLLNLISASDLEDVVAGYLQVKERCILLLSTRKRDVLIAPITSRLQRGSARLPPAFESVLVVGRMRIVALRHDPSLPRSGGD